MAAHLWLNYIWLHMSQFPFSHLQDTPLSWGIIGIPVTPCHVPLEGSYLEEHRFTLYVKNTLV